MITLGRFHYPDPVVVLAPMAGVSDLPFRRLCQQSGAHYSVAEMISAKPDLMATELAETRLSFDSDANTPRIVQLVGGDAALMAEAAQMMVAKGADIIDINMGCPAKVVGKQQAGSALLADETQVAKILEKTVNAVRVPVTLKTRLGPDCGRVNIARIARIAEDAGVQLLAVHGRSRAQKFRGDARYEDIAQVKKNLRIPVIVNGDIDCPDKAKTLIARHGFDGVMIGRAAQGNPWLFTEMRRALDPAFAASLPAPAALIHEHTEALHTLYGRQGLLIARKHLHSYGQTFHLPRAYREAVNTALDPAAQLALIPQWFPHA
ncbi:MAG: tRNA dihydrouridine synthase DusB [Cardiobacteriaceae bacterium]|nr:tRNA dihydrouridine synthase DusB [Cardiobacteriaceae bacterium]